MRQARRPLASIGFLLFVNKLSEGSDIVRRHRPVVVWLFAAEKLKDYTTWTSKIREANPEGIL